MFVHGLNAWAEGIGEHLTFIDLAQKQYIVLKPDCFISTQLLFSQKTLTETQSPLNFAAIRKRHLILEITLSLWHEAYIPKSMKQCGT